MIKMYLNPDLARQFFNVMSATVDEFRLHISKEGWKVAAVDPANVVMTIIDLPKDNFESYEVESGWTSSIDGHDTGVFTEGEIDVGIDVIKIKEFFGSISDLRVDENLLAEELLAPVEFMFSKSDKGDRYQLQLKQGMFSRTILLLAESDIRREPKNLYLILDYRLQLDTLEFQRIVKKAMKVSDYIRLGFNREEVEVGLKHREDPSMGFSRMIFTATALDSDGLPWEATTVMSEPVRHYTGSSDFSYEPLKDGARNSSSSLFSLDYLCDITEKIPSNTVWLHLGHDYPCILSFVLGRTGTVEYKIAPRIEDD